MKWQKNAQDHPQGHPTWSIRHRRICGLICFIALPLLAQSSLIRMRISDFAGDVIPQAEISLLDKGGKVEKVVHANRLGQAVLTNLKVGDYKLRVEAPGFATREMPLTILPDGQTRSLEISLAASASKRGK